MTEEQHDVEAWELREDLARYHDLFEFAPVGLVLTDEAGTIVEANRSAGGLLGLPPLGLIGKPITIFVPLENRREFRRTLAGLAYATTEVEWEFDLEPQESSRLRVWMNASRSPNGQLRWIVQDVTERVATEHRLKTEAGALEEQVLERTDELEEERARLASVVDQMPGGIVVVDAQSGRVLRVNQLAHELLGEIDEVPSLSDDAPLSRALTGATIVAERIEHVKPTGARAVLSVSAAPVRDRAGRITAAVAIFEEVTDLESLARAEREFVTNAAHELQTPIAAITSAVEVLQAGAKDTPDRDLFIEHIERQGQRLVRLTGALLILSRAQTDLEAPRSQLVELCPMVEAIMERMEPAEGVSLSVECPPDLVLIANPELLEQLISNVLRNAVKYTERGSIRIEAERLDGQAEIRVVDTGVGISSEALPRVTERFYRGESSTDGFGLGLAIVESALEVMGGALRIASKGLGQGTIVMMRLPLGATQVRR
jgi:PAS domain S-box-containing protein